MSNCEKAQETNEKIHSNSENNVVSIFQAGDTIFAFHRLFFCVCMCVLLVSHRVFVTAFCVCYGFFKDF